MLRRFFLFKFNYSESAFGFEYPQYACIKLFGIDSSVGKSRKYIIVRTFNIRGAEHIVSCFYSENIGAFVSFGGKRKSVFSKLERERSSFALPV